MRRFFPIDASHLDAPRRNDSHRHGRDVRDARAHERTVPCVGPFNFPFAIVGGLASSAYVAGTPTVIKPHPSTHCPSGGVPRRACAAGADPAPSSSSPDSSAGRVRRARTIERFPRFRRRRASSTQRRQGARRVVSERAGSTKTRRANQSPPGDEPGLRRDEPIARSGGGDSTPERPVADASALPEQVSARGETRNPARGARALGLDAGARRRCFGSQRAPRRTSSSTDVLNLSTDPCRHPRGGGRKSERPSRPTGSRGRESRRLVLVGRIEARGSIRALWRLRLMMR